MALLKYLDSDGKITQKIKLKYPDISDKKIEDDILMQKYVKMTNKLFYDIMRLSEGYVRRSLAKHNMIYYPNHHVVLLAVFDKFDDYCYFYDEENYKKVLDIVDENNLLIDTYDRVTLIAKK